MLHNENLRKANLVLQSCGSAMESQRYEEITKKIQKWSLLGHFDIVQYFFQIFGGQPEVRDFVFFRIFRVCGILGFLGSVAGLQDRKSCETLYDLGFSDMLKKQAFGAAIRPPSSHPEAGHTNAEGGGHG